jgi:hypothetical protein
MPTYCEPSREKRRILILKKPHRKVHFYLWMALLPALLIVVYIGKTGTVDNEKHTMELSPEQQGGRLP